MLDLARLRLLRELERRGTVTAVATALSFSPSAVSQQLATLEREAGTPLLERVGRRVRLTPQAEVLVGHAETLLAEMERAEGALARAAAETVGTVRVAAFQSAVLSLLPDALTSLAEQHPGLRLEVTELEPHVAVPALLAGRYDVVLAEEYPGRPLPLVTGTERREVCRDELLLATPEVWGDVDLPQLTGRPFAMEPAEVPARGWAEGVCRTAGVEPDVRFTSTDLEIHLRLVARGLAASLLPGLSGVADRPGVRASRLRGRPSRSVHSLVRAGSADRPTTVALLDALGSDGDGGGRYTRPRAAP